MDEFTLLRYLIGPLFFAAIAWMTVFDKFGFAKWGMLQRIVFIVSHIGILLLFLFHSGYILNQSFTEL